jgi:pilus assembly protein FimV
MRRLLLLGLALLTSAPVCVYALSLGNLELRSGLHQPLDARVPILSATGEEIETLRVQIAPAEEFARAGVNYAGVLTQLKFEIQQTRKGPDYIRITSRDPVNEPFLNFLVEANWARGRLIREFTALLDPPLYDPSRRVAWEPAKVKGQPAAAPAPRELAAAPAPAPKPAPMPAPAMPVAAAAAAPAPSPVPQPSPAPVRTPDTSGSYPTLWSAATAMRPDNSVSMQQMMVALLRTNPEAFIRGNMNLLKKGYVLKMPEQSELTAVSRAEAIAEVRKHHSLWREYRERGSIAAPKQPKGATSVAASESKEPAPPAPADAETAAADEAKLKLLAGSDAATASPTGEGTGTGSGDLALTKEALESKARENEELRAQLKESEDIIDKLKSRVTLQDSQLAELQQRLGGEAATASTPAAETPAGETPVISQSPAAGGTERWRQLDDVVQTPTYPFPDSTGSAVAPAPTEETTPATETATEQPPEAAAEPPPDIAAEAPPAETPPAEAPTIETPTEPAPTEATTPEQTTAAEEPPPAEEGTPATAAGTEEPAAAETPAEPTVETTEPAADAGIVAKINGIVSGIVPSSILDSIPGGALTLLGGLLAAVGGIGALAMRRRAEPAPESFPTSADDDGSFDRALSGASSEVGETTASMNEDDLFGTSSQASGADDLLDLDAPVPTAIDELAAMPATTPVKSEPDEDPLAEVNVYLAYERFDEAERLIREAIANHPNEHKYKLRLLEVYYSSNNKRAYEDAARDLQAAVGGSGPLWDSAVAMWREMSPNRELFAGGDDLASTLGEAGQRQFVDITALTEDAVSRTLTSAVAAGGTLGEASVSPTATELPGDGPLAFDPGTDTDQAFDMLDITAAGDVRQADNDILDLSASPAVSGMQEPSSIEGASEAVNELLSLTKSGAVVPSADDAASLMESSLDFEAGLLGGDEPGRASTMGPNDLLDFDLGSIAEPTAAKPADNVVDFPASRTEAAPTPPELSTLIDVAPVSAEPPAAPAPETLAAETGVEFDIGGLDLSLDLGAIDETRGPDRELDLKLDSRSAAEVTMGDIDSLSLDEDTVRLFENDLASTNAQDTAPIFGADADLTATGGDFGPLDEAFRESVTTGGGDELTLDSEGDDLTLDDITKSLENTVGARSTGKYGASLETVDLTADSRSLLDAEQTAELFENDLRGSGDDDAFGSATSTLGTAAGDDIDTKLNLAKAYIELGDASGARAILDEVVRDGVDEQRDEANRLLRELTT